VETALRQLERFRDEAVEERCMRRLAAQMNFSRPSTPADKDCEFTLVQTNLRMAVQEVSQDHAARLVLLRFSRFPKEVPEVLLASDLAKRLRTGGVELQPSWAQGKIILAEGANELAEKDHGTWHVAVREHDEESIAEALRALPYNMRPRLKAGNGRFIVEEDQADRSPPDELGEHMEITVQRTFIHLPYESSLCSGSVKRPATD